MDAKFEMREAVRWSYRLFLEREPENEQVITQKLGIKDIPTLRREFMRAEEFRARKGQMTLTPSIEMEPSDIETVLDAAKHAAVLDAALSALDEADADVESWEDDARIALMPPQAGGSMAAFQAAGDRYVAVLESFAANLAASAAAPLRTLEIGAGAGACTTGLARRFGHVEAIAEGETLATALQDAAPSLGGDELTIRTLREFLSDAPAKTTGKSKKAPANSVDLVFSALALHRLPAPVVETVLSAALARLAPGGLALIQLPTQLAGYDFDVEGYLETADEAEEPFHVTAQEQIFAQLRAADCELLSVREDSIAPHPTDMGLTVFIARKAIRN